MKPVVRNTLLALVVLSCGVFGFQNCGKIQFDVSDLDPEEFLDFLSTEPQYCETMDDVIYERVFIPETEEFSECQATRCAGGLDLSFDLDDEPYCS